MGQNRPLDSKANSFDQDEDQATVYQSRQYDGRITRSIRALKAVIRRSKTVAIIVDGPNVLRKINGRTIRLEQIEHTAAQLGLPTVRKVLLNNQAPDKLRQAIVNSGFQPVVSASDIYIEMATISMEIASTNGPDIVLIASRHARCTPIVFKLKSKGIQVAVMGFEPGFSVALKNAADYAFAIEA